MAPLLLSLLLASAAPSTVDAAPSESSQHEEGVERPWMQRHLPRRGQWELGAFGGLMIIGGRHDYYDPVTSPQVRLRRVGPMAGLRAAYFPLSFVGVEAEGWGIWSEVPARADAPVFLYALRGQGVLQLPLYRVVPFVLGGYGLTGVRSPRDAVGNDLDPAGHYGAGVKLMVDDRFAVRLEGRHTMGPARARRRQVANHFSILVGLSVRLGPQPTTHAAPAPRAAEAVPATEELHVDSDGDGVRDASDACPTLPGVFPQGCPQPDFDDDGLPDAVDRCPSEPAKGGDGCPVRDSDGDGLVDTVDRCPWEKSIERDGCIAPPAPVPAPDPVSPQTD